MAINFLREEEALFRLEARERMWAEHKAKHEAAIKQLEYRIIYRKYNGIKKNNINTEIEIQQLERSWSCFGFFLTTQARDKYFQPSLSEQVVDCHEELSNAPDPSERARIIARYRNRAFWTAVDCLRMTIQRRLINELKWIAGKVSRP